MKSGDNINVHDLKSWGARAAERLQEIVNEAQNNAGSEAEPQCLDIRALLDEHSRIMKGLSPVSWLDTLKNNDRIDAGLIVFCDKP